MFFRGIILATFRRSRVHTCARLSFLDRQLRCFSYEFKESRFFEIERAVKRSMREFRSRRAVLVLSCTAVTGGLVYIYWGDLVGHISVPVSDVASDALSTKDFQIRAETFSKAVVHQVLHDEEIRERALDFVQDLLSRDGTRKILSQLFVGVLGEPSTKQQATELSKDIATNLLHNQKIQQDFEELVGYAIKSEANRQRWIELLDSLLHQDAIQQSVSDIAVSAAHNTLENEAIQRHAEQFIENLLKDKSLQHESSNALWSVVKETITPQFIKRFYPTSDPQNGCVDAPASNSREETLHPMSSAQGYDSRGGHASGSQSSSSSQDFVSYDKGIQTLQSDPLDPLSSDCVSSPHLGSHETNHQTQGISNISSSLDAEAATQIGDLELLNYNPTAFHNSISMDEVHPTSVQSDRGQKSTQQDLG